MKREYPSRPISAVGVAVFKQEKVLLIKRNKPPKSFEWSIPGGAQDLGEPAKEAARREVMEETGIEISDIELIDVIDFVKKDENGDIEYHYNLIDYSASYYRGDLSPGDDAIEAKWVSLSDLEEYNLWSETKALLNKAAIQRKIR